MVETDEQKQHGLKRSRDDGEDEEQTLRTEQKPTKSPRLTKNEDNTNGSKDDEKNGVASTSDKAEHEDDKKAESGVEENTETKQTAEDEAEETKQEAEAEKTAETKQPTEGEETSAEQPAEDKKEDATSKPEESNEPKKSDGSSESKEEQKTKPVFGSGFAFGGSFGMSLPKKNVFGSGSGSNSSDTSKKPVFGSGFALGGNVLKDHQSSTKNVFDEKSSSTSDSKTSTDDKDESKASQSSESTSASNKDQYVQLDQPLEQKSIETGEETEKTVFSCECALYAMDLGDVAAAKTWKERGKGTLHLNTQQEENGDKSRLVMRSRGVLKVILNIQLVKNAKIQTGFPSSLHGEKFVRVNAIENGKPHQYAIRTGSKDTADELYQHILNLIDQEK